SPASFWIVGDGMPPPNVAYCPNPVSSSRMSTTFGAPLGACTGCGNCGLSESRIVRPTLPGKWKSGRGSTVGGLAVGQFFPGPVRSPAGWPDAASQPPTVPTASTAAATGVIRVRMGSTPVDRSLLERVNHLPLGLHVRHDPARLWGLVQGLVE